MKYIKNFESKKEYNIGDYVLTKKGIFIPGYQLCRIIGLYTTKYHYDVEFADGWITDIPDKYIERLLTSNEIEQYEAEKTGNKYNL